MYTTELFHTVGCRILGYVGDTTIYEAILRPPSHPHMLELLKQKLAAIDSWCLKWNMRFNPKTKSMVVSLSRTYAPSYGDLTLGGAELEECLHILEVALGSKVDVSHSFA